MDANEFKLELAKIEAHLPFSQAVSIYDSYRAKIVAEDNLTGHRMAWLLAAQAILFTFWGVIDHANLSKTLIGMAPQIFINIIGMFVGYGCHQSLYAARSEITKVKGHYQNAYPFLYDSRNLIPKLHSADVNFFAGNWLAQVMPWVFMVTQLLAMLYCFIQIATARPPGS